MSTYSEVLMWVGLCLCIIGIPVVLFDNPKSYHAAKLFTIAAVALVVSTGLQLAPNLL
ncbi:hypothetical protein [Mycobacteroides abscessus]|uniref:hypothetical protein n=1 Tax=Mycobacteroides abscessus TaxID=36809 RepID=UPI00092942A6|nr:hypothetical protein [Mycobacteroides abscessus]MDO2986902.1 hypothetical protein [Mycobacteroides abscessus subsp. abscessus]SIA24879.1 Uncharacterised protein [Mycobacteroides abscessus subsp. abscessus]SID33819.1 Uncharacterised protein [Mycobacteroides abscessus subsp. abscessus]SIJ94789.1 Uncharacterised protein [Mycobacteroides abscessus subsp. abscessus]SKT80893.1 Uncharacterised protein [Mycobacteroides abscessus subsp. massiliense]